MPIDLREFDAAADHGAGRRLWAELTEAHRLLYADPTIGGEDPGHGFDEYLAHPQRRYTCVAVRDGAVIGLSGLLDQGQHAEVEPVVVTEAERGRGVGAALLAHVVAVAAGRGYAYAAVRPVARNVDAIRAFHAAGFRTLGGHVDLTMDLGPRRHAWLDGVELHDRRFTY